MPTSIGVEPETSVPDALTETGSLSTGPLRSSWFYLKPWERDLLLLSTVLKLFLFPTYRSTDFEVHRNWLAITHSLPLSQWYYDKTSEWTLDYPPFFAYFEKVMSVFAAWYDVKIVELSNLNYSAWSVVVFQRSTVIITELVLGVALLRFAREVPTPAQRIISASLFLHPGFLIVDHIHFQYNGFMFGILLWSILAMQKGQQLLGGFLFAVLLNFKHIYMYLAPAYFVYLLRSYCLSPNFRIQPMHFLSLANVVIAVFIVSLGPFALMGQLPQLLSRLFPFTRGLNHAYWAPNAWALVTAADRVFLKIAPLLGIQLAANAPGVASTSRGLVGDTVFAILPNVEPIHTFAITLAFQMIFLVKLWLTPTYKSFLTALTLCGYTSYMFGWHVHEKAILLVLVPFSLLAADGNYMFRTFMITSAAGIYSLFPLLFTPAESFVKLVYSVLWGIFVLQPLSKLVYRFPRTVTGVVIDRLEILYLAGFPILHLLVTVLPWLNYWRSSSATFLDTTDHLENSTAHSSTVVQAESSAGMEFLPLLLTSVYCAVGLVWAFVKLGAIYLTDMVGIA